MKRKFTVLLILLTVFFCTLGASCQNGPVVPPPNPQTDVEIYKVFFQVEAKYNATYDLVVEFTKLTASVTNLGCSANVVKVCDAGKAYKKFYDTKLVPASKLASDAYTNTEGTGALDYYQKYRAGQIDLKTLQDAINKLSPLVDDLKILQGQGSAEVAK